MAYNMQEQEQIDAIKAFWNRYGIAILAALTVAMLVFAGVRGWNAWQARQAGQAAAVFAELTTAIDAKNIEQIKSRAQTLQTDYGSTVYGPMAALLAARAQLDAKDPAAAKQSLQWVVDHAKDDVFKQLARLRLAGLLLDEKAYDEALKLVDGAAASKPTNDMAASLADRRADILAAQGKLDDARADYDRALALVPATSPLRQFIQLKRDALAG